MYTMHINLTQERIYTNLSVFLPVRKANSKWAQPTQNHTNEAVACPDLGTIIPSSGRPCWSHVAVECSDVGFNSSFLLFWFDLSTPGYSLSNKAWRGWGNHVLVNRSVLRQETSRTACVSNHLGGRSSVGSHDHRFHQNIVFHTWCML